MRHGASGWYFQVGYTYVRRSIAAAESSSRSAQRSWSKS